MSTSRKLRRRMLGDRRRGPRLSSPAFSHPACSPPACRRCGRPADGGVIRGWSRDQAPATTGHDPIRVPLCSGCMREPGASVLASPAVARVVDQLKLTGRFVVFAYGKATAEAALHPASRLCFGCRSAILTDPAKVEDCLRRGLAALLFCHDCAGGPRSGINAPG